jgi:Protein of unknown function (DUF2726)
MTGVVFLIGGVLVAIALALTSNMTTSISEQRNPTSPFKRKKQLLSSNELEFYELLKISIPEENTVLIKIRLDDFLNLPLSAEKQDEWLEHALHMNVDFLICLSSSMIPYLAVDYRDYESFNRKQKYHDSLKEKMLQDAGISFICYDLNQIYEKSELVEDITEAYEEFQEEILSDDS